MLALPAWAQTPPPPRTVTGAPGALESVGQVLFDAAEKAIIEKFFGRSATAVDTISDSGADRGGKGNKNKGNKSKGKKKGLPPGLAKKTLLPPGLQRQLERNGRLPPGLAKRDLPADLQSQLPPAKDGTERVIAGADVVLIHEATGVVLDILRDVVTR
jgi:hypothetical protein